MITKKHGGEFDPHGGEKKSTAESEPKAEAKAKSQGIQPFAFTAPPGFTAGTAITVTPYQSPGKPTIYVVGNIVNGSEEATLMTIKNLLFLPAIAS